MTKKQLSQLISEKTGEDAKDCLRTLLAFIESVKDTMCKGENIYLRGFGTFKVYRRNEKKGRLITKKKSVLIPAHNICKFKPCKSFKKQLKKSVPIQK